MQEILSSKTASVLNSLMVYWFNLDSNLTLVQSMIDDFTNKEFKANVVFCKTKFQL